MPRINTDRLFHIIRAHQHDAESRAKEVAANLGHSPKGIAFEFHKWIYQISSILEIDADRLLCWYKGVKKWHEKREWEIIFPFEENRERTLEYLKREEWQ